MLQGPNLKYYLGVLRKHWLLSAIIFALTLGGGYYYRSRQVPEYEASARLKIQRGPTRTVGGEATFSFEEDQVFYNTQYFLLRTQLEWADQALDRAAYRLLTKLEIPWREAPEEAGRLVAARLGGEEPDETHIGIIGRSGVGEFAALEDPPPELVTAIGSVRREVMQGLWKLNEDAFLSGISAKPIPQTFLAELSFRSKFRLVSVFLVNIYAGLYRDNSTEERAETLAKEIEYLVRSRQELDEDLKAAQRELGDFRKEHSELSLGEAENLPQKSADAIARRINEHETLIILRQADEKNLLALLARRGVRLVGDPPSSLALDDTGEGAADLHRFLAEDMAILGNAIVAESENVVILRERIRGLEQERFRLPSDLTDESLPVRRLKAERERELSRLGVEVEATVIRYLSAGRRTRETITDLTEKWNEKRAEAGTVASLHVKLSELDEAAQELRRQRSSVDARLESLEELRLTKDEHAGGRRLSIRYIEVERPARLRDARVILPNKTAVLVLSIAAALVLSLGVAFLLEFVDDSIKTKEDLTRLVGIPDVAHVPLMSVKDQEQRDLAVLENPRSPIAEAFRTLRTAILFSKRDTEMKSLVVTSATQGEGKTTVAANLAVTMAQADRGNVLLIDTDLRKPRIHTALGIENGIGLTNCLVGAATLEDAVRPTQVDNLFVLTSGPTPPNPAELLGGYRMKEILAEAGAGYTKIILDTPPLVAVTDPCLLAPLVDGVFLVISVGSTSWRLVQRGKEALQAVGVDVTGVVMNCARTRSTSYMGYEYGYGYGEEEAQGGKAGGKVRGRKSSKGE